MSENNVRTVGMTMLEIQETLVFKYIEGLKANKRPGSVMIWGPPGCGKTFSVYAACKQIPTVAASFNFDIPDIQCRAMLTSCMDPTDIQGPPFPVDVKGMGNVHSQYLPLDWAWYASKEYENWYQKQDDKDPDWTVPGPMIIFFDDIVAAHFQTQTAFFKVVHEGMVGSLHLRDNVMIVAAGNRVSDNAGANDMPTALASRFEHCYADQTVESWLDWALDEGDIHHQVIGFIRAHNDKLNTFDADTMASEEKAFACQRTWEMVSDILHAEVVPYSTDGHNYGLFSKRAMGIIGAGVGVEFTAYLRKAKMCVPPADIVKNPSNASVPSASNLDSLYATISSLEHYIKENPSVKNIEAACVYCSRDELSREAGLLLAKTISNLVKKLTGADKFAIVTGDKMRKILEIYEDLIMMDTDTD